MLTRSLSTHMPRAKGASAWKGRWRLSTYPAFVSIPASDVAAVTGRNVFKPATEAFNDLWKRYSPQTFTGETTIDAQLAAFARCLPEEQEVLTKAATYTATDAQDAVRTMSNATSIIKNSSTITEEDKSKVLDLLSKEINTAHGERTEDKAVDVHSSNDGLKYSRSDEIYMLPLCTIDGTDYVVRGRIDRLVEHDGEVVLVEVKSRMKRLFREVREYEYVQVQTYLQMLPQNVRRAKLVEHYMDETAEMWVERDDEEWELILRPALLKFCLELDAKMKGKELSSVHTTE